MKEFEERLLKRWLKRKVKITMATIVAFLIGSSLSLAETLYIRDGANGIEFSIDNQNWGENPYSENTFENGIYTNNIGLVFDRYGVFNTAKNFSFINKNSITVNSDKSTWWVFNEGNLIDLINEGNIEVKTTTSTTVTGIENTDENSSIKNFTNEGKLIVDSETADSRGVSNFGKIDLLNNSGEIFIKGNEQIIGIGNYGGTIGELLNQGIIKVTSSNGKIWGIDNSEKITKLENSGLIELNGVNNTTGIGNYGGTIGELLNQGILRAISSSGNVWGISNQGPQNKIENSGLLEVNGVRETTAIYNNNQIGNVINKGQIKTSSDNPAWGIWNDGSINSIENKGLVKVLGGQYSVRVIHNNSGSIGSIKNDGILSATGTNVEDTATIRSIGEKIENNGIIFSSNHTIYTDENQINTTNNGILIGNSENFIKKSGTNNGIMFSYDSTNKNYKIQGYKDTDNNGIKVGEKTIINATLIDEQNKDTDNWKATGSNSIVLSKGESDMIYNGITDTLKVSGDKTLTNSIVNGYTSAIVFDVNGGSLTLDNSIINGGLDEVSATIKGESGVDNLALVNNTIINGNIDLGAGADKLSIDNTVQLNGDLLGGVGDDSLTFNSKGISTFGSGDENNINIFNRVDGFENINVATDVTLFESAEVVGAGSIAIQKDGNLVLRIDSTNSNNHALSKNTGTISSEGGKLLLALNGVGEGETISFGDTSLDETMKGNEEGLKEATIDTTSLLHNIKKIDNKTVEVSTEENIPYVNAVNYNELNRIYQSLRSIDGVGEFNVTDDKALAEFTNYLHDIYANNPYSFSSTLSRKSVNMFSNIVMDRDLHPEVNKWAIYGGLTHIDGGTKDTYYGKGYYTYDIGSKDIDIDSKITGMYAQGEYGVNETLNLGVIFGGNQSESEINSNSKVEGDSFYLGAYVKKYLGNLRLLAGVGYQYGDYKVDRVAVGYDGITTTRTFDSNYNDNTFNIYAQAKYSNKLVENLYLEPSVALDYTYINQDGASEDGVLAIETDDKNFNYTTAKFGVDLRKDIPTTSATHSLVAGAYYNRMLDGYEEENITGRFVGGSDFDILVSPSNKHELGLRAKYEVELNNGVTFDVKGSYTFARESYSGENKNEHKGEWLVGVGIGYKF